MTLEQLSQKHKNLAFSVAYQMLGSNQDAEDVVQEVYVQLETIDLTTIDEHKAYTMKIVVNKCLNHLKLARHKKEVYIGPWLPEPLFDKQNDESLNRLIQKESVSYAFHVLNVDAF